MYLLAGICLLSACKKESPTKTINDSLQTDTSAVVKYAGLFVNGPYGSVAGTAKIYLKNGTYTLALENFNASNGPDLKVYLSQEENPVHYISLGSLQSTNGNQLYMINGSPDFTSYKYALIHCEQYNHLFGSAILQ